MKTRLFLLAVLTLAPWATAATTCESLTSLYLPQATVTMAASIAPGSFTPPASFSPGPAPAEIAYKDLPAFCRIAATLRPSSDSEIKIEVWLPQSSAWNDRFMAVGNGGTAGQISYDAMRLPLTRAFFYAGAPSIIASLWDVPDQPTNRLIPGFYASWLGGRSRVDALRAAQLRLLADLRTGRVKIHTQAGDFALVEDPALWAGFMASKAFRLLLDSPLPAQRPRAAWKGPRDPGADPEDGEIESIVGRTPSAR